MTEDYCMKLLLASNSPRRSELLRNAGFDFEVIPSGIDEGMPLSGEPPEEYARRLARAKALRCGRRFASGQPGFGRGTIVTIDGLILGKPSGPSDAARMLRIALRPDARGDHGDLPGPGAGPDRRAQARNHFCDLPRARAKTRFAPMWPAASPLTKPAPMPFKAWPRSSSPAFPAVISMSSAFRFPALRGLKTAAMRS